MVIYLKTILVIEDDINIHDLIKELLIQENYNVIDAYSGTEALLVLEKERVDLILLDLMLPGLDGEEIIERMSNIPIIVISAKAGIEDKVNVLMNGANDYITKPFDSRELLARVRVQLRLNTNDAHSNTFLEYKDIKLLKDNRTLLVFDNQIGLTKTEYAIMKQLLVNQNHVISKSRLLDLISENTPDCDENSLKVHVSNLRRKIRKYTDIEYIESVWGIGYKLYD